MENATLSQNISRKHRFWQNFQGSKTKKIVAISQFSKFETFLQYIFISVESFDFF